MLVLSATGFVAFAVMVFPACIVAGRAFNSPGVWARDLLAPIFPFHQQRCGSPFASGRKESPPWFVRESMRTPLENRDWQISQGFKVAVDAAFVGIMRPKLQREDAEDFRECVGVFRSDKCLSHR